MKAAPPLAVLAVLLLTLPGAVEGDAMFWSGCSVAQGLFLIEMDEARERVPPPLVPLSVGPALARLDVGILRCTDDGSGSPVAFVCVCITVEPYGPAASTANAYYEYALGLAASSADVAGLLATWTGARVEDVAATSGPLVPGFVARSSAEMASGTLRLTHVVGSTVVATQPAEVYRFLASDERGIVGGFDLDVGAHGLVGGPGTLEVEDASGWLAYAPRPIADASIVGHVGAPWSVAARPVAS